MVMLIGFGALGESKLVMKQQPTPIIHRLLESAWINHFVGVTKYANLLCLLMKNCLSDLAKSL